MTRVASTCNFSAFSPHARGYQGPQGKRCCHQSHSSKGPDQKPVPGHTPSYTVHALEFPLSATALGFPVTLPLYSEKVQEGLSSGGLLLVLNNVN